MVNKIIKSYSIDDDVAEFIEKDAENKRQSASFLVNNILLEYMQQNKNSE